ncbi:MAG: hypothetical protein QF464_13610 [Myxococcota bacterium]|jgi:hypothetical protein|nr:hypothetical protein [Myxococcota bacterium]
MRTVHLLVSLCFIASLSTLAAACASNPTPHPVNEDPTDYGPSGEASPGGGAGNNVATDDERGLSDGAMTDAGALPSAPERADTADTAGPDSDAGVEICEEIVAGFHEALSNYQTCETHDDCVLLVDDNDCDCTRAIAVSDLDAAQALLNLALSCATEEEELLGYCEADTAPLGNVAFCEDGECLADTPGESCLSVPDEVDASIPIADDAWSATDDVGPGDDSATQGVDAEEGDAGVAVPEDDAGESSAD